MNSDCLVRYPNILQDPSNKSLTLIDMEETLQISVCYIIPLLFFGTFGGQDTSQEILYFGLHTDLIKFANFVPTEKVE